MYIYITYLKLYFEIFRKYNAKKIRTWKFNALKSPYSYEEDIANFVKYYQRHWLIGIVCSEHSHTLSKL